MIVQVVVISGYADPIYHCYNAPTSYEDVFSISDISTASFLYLQS